MATGEKQSVLRVPDTAVKIERFNGVDYDRYWFDFETERVIMQSKTTRWDLWYVNTPRDSRGRIRFRMIGTDGKRREISWNRFYQWCKNKWDMVHVLELESEVVLRDDD